MLKLVEVRKILRTSKPQLAKWGVCEIGLFGSFVRNQASADSDVDILLDFETDKETYANFMETCNFLESVLSNLKLDIVSKKGLSPFIGPHILKEVEYV
ncbi:nucleotidyltransferase family protein [Dyadobacter aurulentus]|uniref:nucleotidyltransferase family protein n=1 Tax=Dyadobacter sp. UC 10 TaxID=2605428 RepID=UPI0011F3E7E9|nr:nucleotidyltransferase family protein [Dyadobacter sp. UC 10]KAA0992570.1 nucleotidyltransferase family protein [Dyadobacter sp. UC 10]